jgi:hypothetical protein
MTAGEGQQQFIQTSCLTPRVVRQKNMVMSPMGAMTVLVRASSNLPDRLTEREKYGAGNQE